MEALAWGAREHTAGLPVDGGLGQGPGQEGVTELGQEAEGSSWEGDPRALEEEDEEEEAVG